MKKKINLIFILFFLIYCSCESISQYKLMIEIPTPTKIDLSSYNKIIFTSFKIESEIKEINFNKEIFNFFSSEIEREFKGKILFKEIDWSQKNIIENKEYWKTLLNNSKTKKLFFTGKLNFKKELRKALLEEQAPATPFPERKLISRLFFTLNLDLYLIDSNTGEIIYEKDFKESRGYKNINQKPNYAFFDILEEVKNKLFREIISHKKREERFLIIK